jgi:anaerobic magnesium-protoporphyrin IX monomethyl ester cyclase
MNDLKVSLFSVPVEAAGTKLDRKRSEGATVSSPKWAIQQLMNEMKLAGMERRQYDFYDIDMMYPTDSEIKEYLLSYQPTVVGLSAVLSTSYSQVKRISKIIRELLPSTWVVMGGNLSAVSEAVLEQTDVDLSVVGDGEDAWIKLLEYMRSVPPRVIDSDKLLKINGVVFIDNNDKVQLNGFGVSTPAERLVTIDYELLLDGCKGEPEAINNYFKNANQVNFFDLDDRAQDPKRRPMLAGVFTSKGCVARCTFCQRSTKGYRVIPLELIEEHLTHLRDDHDVGFISILDENFGSNKAYAYELAKLFDKFDMLWTASGIRVTSVNKEDIKFFKDHGCSYMKFGVETGSQRILDLMEKKFKVEDIYNALKACIDLGVKSPLAVMVGMPGETEKTAMETGELIGKLAARIGVHPEDQRFEVFYALPLPGTPLYEYGEQLGVIGKNVSDAAEFLELVADSATFRRYYINLNGAPMSEVLFWENLVRLEASRTFKKYNDKPVNRELLKSFQKSTDRENKNNPRTLLRYTALKFTTITYIIENYIIGNKVFDYIPRWVLYPVVKYMTYFEYIIQHMFSKNRKNNIFVNFTKVPRLDEGSFTMTHKEPDLKASKKGSKKYSLRSVVSEKREGFGVNKDSVHQVLIEGL